MCEENPQQALDELRQAVKEALYESLPYITQHQAFLMPSVCWNRLAVLVDPRIAKFDELLKKMDRGEKLTQEEIAEAVGFDLEQE